MSIRSKQSFQTAPSTDVSIFNPPDWKTPDSYAYLHDAPLRLIAWEFLRRNADYQKAWSEYAARVLEIAAQDAEVAKYADLFLSSNASEEDWVALGDETKLNDLGEMFYQLGFFCEISPHHFAALDMHYGDPWGLESIVNPAKNYSRSVCFKESAGTVTIPFSNYTKASETVPDGQPGLSDTKWLDLRVDLSLPLKVIDAQIKKMVRMQREKKERNGVIKPIVNRDISPKKYAEYLRILDASKTGISASDIGAAIEPDRINHSEHRQRDKRYGAALTEAKRLQSTGYRVLPLLEFSSRKSSKKK